jgi:hypothetical protein
VLSREDEIGPSFEIDAALLSHAAVIGAAGSLQETAAAIAKAIAWLCVAERARLARIAETIDTLGDRFRPVRERRR